ncbi:MAG: phosphatase PAP2 family protein [Candidatus Phytoplasma sp. TWB_XP]
MYGSCLWWWFFIAPYLIYKYLDKKIIFQLLISYFIILTISLIFFFVFPVQMLKDFQFKFDNNKNFIDYSIKKLYENDYQRLNNLPSFHVSLSWLCYVGFRQKNEKIPKILNYGQLIFVILVFISTFVLKQHYIMDGIIAIILVETTFFLVGKKMNNIKKDYLN